MSGLASKDVEKAFLAACYGELQALKPGNVHVHAGGHKLSVEQFEKSADAAAPEIACEGVSVGQRVLNAVKATRDAVGTNTNLGIILLCAPIAQAAMTEGSEELEDKLKAVLKGLSVQDAVDAYEAIRLAEPGGMGSAEEHDVVGTPTITLLEAMEASADRDQIAYQYAHGFVDVFRHGATLYSDGLALFKDQMWATCHLFMGFLSNFPDSLIVRKYGLDLAQGVCSEADAIWSGAAREDRELLTSRLLAFDRSLKERKLNPGTSADITVATLFLYHLRK